MRYIVNIIIGLALLCTSAAYAWDNKEYSRGELRVTDYLPAKGWTLPEGYTQERFIGSVYKMHKLNDFPWTMTFQVRGRGVVFLANKIYKTWHVLPLDYENLNFGSILTDYHMFDKGEGCFVYIIDGYGNGEMGSGGKPIFKILEKCADMKTLNKMIKEQKEREREANLWLQQQILAEHCRRTGNC